MKEPQWQFKFLFWPRRDVKGRLVHGWVMQRKLIEYREMTAEEGRELNSQEAW